MALSPITTSDNRAATTTASASGQSLGQNDFLRLLTTQLTNQSPLDPMSNEQFVAQMAQISTSTGVAELKAEINSLREEVGQNRLSEAAGYIGRTAMVGGYPVTPGEDGVAGTVEVSSAAEAMFVHVVDANGDTVRSLPLGAQQPGTTAFQWDGKTSAGDPAGDGPFLFSAEAIRAGQSSSASAFIKGEVTSVSISGSGEARLVIEGMGRVPPGALAQLS
ncbi:flagellar hook assembly protein FlgD [Pacificimonas sp. ICDLI1SI03]